MEKIQLTKTRANLLSYVHAPIILLDQNFTIVDLTRQWCKLFDVKKHRVTNKPFSEVFPNFFMEHSPIFERVLGGASDQKIVPSKGFPDGVKSLLLNPLKNGYGDISGIIIEAKKGKKNSFKAESAQPLEKTNYVLLGSWEYDMVSGSVVVTKSLQKAFNFRGLSLTLEQFLAPFPKKKAIIITEYLEKKSNNLQWEEHIEPRFAEGKSHPLKVMGRPKISDGKVVKVIGVIEEQQPEEAASALEAKNYLRDTSNPFFDASPVPMVVLDLTDGTIKDINQETQKLIGLGKSELYGIHFSSLVNKDIAFLRNLVRIGRSWEMNPFNACIEIDKDKKAVYSIQSLPIVEGISQNQAVLALMPPLVLKKTAAENPINEGSETLTSIVHMLAHDLKAQAANISLLLNFIDAEGEEASRKDFFNMLKRSSQKLTHSIKDLRELVNIRHCTKQKQKHILVNDMVYAAEERLSGFLRKNNAKIFSEIGDDFKIKAIPPIANSIMLNMLSGILNLNKSNGSTSSLVILKGEIGSNNSSIIHIEDNISGAVFNGRKNLPGTKGFKPGAEFMEFAFAQYQLELLGGSLKFKKNNGAGGTYSLHFNA